MKFKEILFIIISFFSCLSVYSQEHTLAGKLLESKSKSSISNASVAVFLDNSEKIDYIQLSETDGSFRFKLKKSFEKIRLEISHISFNKKVIDIKSKSSLSMGDILLKRSENILDEAIVTPPVVLKGDTVEFNADAFKLDSNSVAEDLFLRLPGLMLWGDGAITYKGKKIQSVLVNNKEFFGKDFKNAIQNIPTHIIDKVQVYDNRTEDLKKRNPNDEKFEVNIKIKQGKEEMFFGQIGAGGGTFRRYDLVSILNYANKKIQLTLGGSNNNTNKYTYNIDQLITNTTYKAGDISKLSNQDIFYPGIKQQRSIGAKSQYDFLKESHNQLKNNITVSNYYWVNNEFNKDSSKTLTFLDGIYTPTRESVMSQSSESSSNQFDLSYNYENKKPNNLDVFSQIDANFQKKNSKNNSRYIFNEKIFVSEIPSYNQIREESSNENSEYYFKFNSTINLIKKKFTNEFLFKIMMSNYLKLNDAYSKIDKFNPNLLNLENDTLISRNYDLNTNYSQGATEFQIFGFEKLFFKSQSIWRLKIKSSNLYNLSNSDQKVQEIFYSQNFEMFNNKLTYDEKYKQLYSINSLLNDFTIYKNVIPGFSEKELSVDLNSGLYYFQLKNHSSILERQLNKQQLEFLPAANINYRFRKPLIYGSWIFGIRKDYVQPTVSQYQPIYDDINQYIIYEGNRRLQRSNSLNFDLAQNLIFKNVTNLSSYLYFKIINDDIIDSISFLKNKRYYNFVNANKVTNQYGGNFKLDHPIKINDNSNISVSYQLNFNLKDGSYILNEQEVHFKRIQGLQDISLYYNLFDKIKFGLVHSFRRQLNKEFKDNEITKLKYQESSTSLKVSYFITDKLCFLSDLTSKNNKANSISNDFFIWNAQLNYRMLKGNNLEVGISAFDILNENKGIVVRENVNEMNFIVQNTLKRYCSLSLKYYPRFFKK